MPRFINGEQIWWFDRADQVRYGKIRSHAGQHSMVVVGYNEFMQLDKVYYLERERVMKYHPNGLRKLREAIKLINIGRLQYNQHFFRSPKKKKQKIHWRSGYEQYKRLCKEYGVPVSPKRPVSNVSEEW